MKRVIAAIAAAAVLPAFAAGPDWNELLRKGIEAATKELTKQQAQKPESPRPAVPPPTAAPAPAPVPQSYPAPAAQTAPQPAAQARPKPAPTEAEPLMAGLSAPLPLRTVPLIVGNGTLQVLVNIDGTVGTWGRPGAMAGRPGFGDGSRAQGSPETWEPKMLAGLPPIVDAAIGFGSVLLLTREGTVLAWGNNDGCEVGAGEHDNTIRSPIPVRGLRGIKAVAAGNLFSGALHADGSVWVWGTGDQGQLADGRTDRHDCVGHPVRVEGLGAVKQLSFGDIGLALKEDGTVWGWGPNSGGALCDGTKERRGRPVQAIGVTNAAYVDAGDQTFIVLTDRTLLTCGAGTGITKASAVPVRVPGLPPVRTARSDRSTYFVHLVDGRVLGWGNGYHGSLGNGHADTEYAGPREPIGLGPVLAHALSMSLSYAIRADGTVIGWGQWINKGDRTEWITKPTPVPFTVKVAQP